MMLTTCFSPLDHVFLPAIYGRRSSRDRVFLVKRPSAFCQEPVAPASRLRLLSVTAPSQIVAAKGENRVRRFIEKIP
jgi:hypothetical protein